MFQVNKRRQNLIRKATPAEIMAMKQLVSLPVRLRFQHKINRFGKTYFLDFFLPVLDIGIEIDGGIHDNRGSYDTKRDIDLMSGKTPILMIRFDNDLVMKQPKKFLELVKETIKNRIKQLKDNNDTEKLEAINKKFYRCKRDGIDEERLMTDLYYGRCKQN
jgi:very-short-patch-repair endonuclease